MCLIVFVFCIVCSTWYDTQEENIFNWNCGFSYNNIINIHKIVLSSHAPCLRFFQFSNRILHCFSNRSYFTDISWSQYHSYGLSPKHIINTWLFSTTNLAKLELVKGFILCQVRLVILIFFVDIPFVSSCLVPISFIDIKWIKIAVTFIHTPPALFWNRTRWYSHTTCTTFQAFFNILF